MASASVVEQHPGPHRLDSEPQVLFLKMTSASKKIIPSRRSSWDKITFRRSPGSSSETGSVTAEGECRAHRLSPGPAEGSAVKGGMMLDERCVSTVTPAAPRSPDRGRQTGSFDCDRRTRKTGARLLSGDCNSNCDFNLNAGGRSGRSNVNAMSSGSATSGHQGGHPHRDAPQRRRDTWSGDNRHRSIPSSVQAQGESSGLPLERLTQGRTGVVRLARTEPPRMEAWSIFSRGMDPPIKAERGEGHRFAAMPVTQDWCDACSRQVTAQALKCQNCSYTCHLECERNVQLDCNQRDKEPEKTPPPRSQCPSTASHHKQNEAKEEEERRTKDLSEEEVRKRIEEYNSQDSENGMKLASDGSYTGFIKVHLRLSRPVTVLTVEAAGSEGESRQIGGHHQATSESQQGMDREPSDKRTSFYLPSDCVKQIHISSQNTTTEVIQGLLKKFMVLDNPRKFALYRQTHRDGQDLFQKLPLCERPLLLRLIAGTDPNQLSFVLKENETGEVEWHAFSVPELQNFLVILDKEEAERVRAVEQKYTTYRNKLQQALRQLEP